MKMRIYVRIGLEIAAVALPRSCASCDYRNSNLFRVPNHGKNTAYGRKGAVSVG